MFQILIDRHKDVEALLRQVHELAVGDAAPAHPLNRLHLVVRERRLDARIDALV